MNKSKLKITQISNSDIKQMFFMACYYINQEKNYLNEINVFPVPDGDTGSNIAHTMNGIKNEIQKQDPENLNELSDTIRKSSMIFSRGNSGTVLSQFFDGFCQVFGNNEFLNDKLFVRGFELGYEKTLKAFENPTKGTIIDIVEGAYKSMRTKSMDTDNIVEILKHGVINAEKSLEKTKYIIQEITGNKVHDSGGAGFLNILNGFLISLQKEDTNITFHHHNFNIENAKNYNIEKYKYCSEFIVANCINSIDDIKKYLVEYGESLQINKIDNIVKIHIHTDKPQDVKELLSEFGTIYDCKIENMQEQMDLNKSIENSGMDYLEKLLIDNKKDKVSIILDSGADIPKEWFEKYPIKIVPLHITDNDGEDIGNISNTSFYESMKGKNAKIYKTSQANVGQFMEAYKQCLQISEKVICITMSSKVSGTYQSALLAKKELNNDNIELIDSKSGSMGIAIICKYFFDNIEKMNIEDLINKINNFHEKINITVFLGDLSYLSRSGRIGSKKLVLGKLLRISPIFNLKDGGVLIDKKIIFSNYIKKKRYLINELKQFREKKQIDNIFILYTDLSSKKRAKKFYQTSKKKFGIKDENIHLMSLTKVIGVHIGPGSWGMIYN